MKYNKVLVNELDVKNKVVFLRLDLNVPIIDNKITSLKRIDASLPTIKYLVENQAKVVILSHMGRINPGYEKWTEKLSLQIVSKTIAKKMLPLAKAVTFVSANKGNVVEDLIKKMEPGSILVLENTRYNDLDQKGKQVSLESKKNIELSKYWANLSDVFVNDAYGAAHRDHASTAGIAENQKNNAIGFLMESELKQLSKAVDEPVSPFVVIFGGAKVSDKLKAVEAVIGKADKVIISGGMAYTFLKAQGYDMGLSSVEDHLLDTARDLLKKYPEKIVVSKDFLCSPTFSDEKPVYKTAEDGLKGYMGLDIGKKSIEEFKKIIKTANTILWNGPMGVTEFDHYETGTMEICKAIAERTKAGAYTVIGGGDSAAAAEKLGMEKSFSWISTGGGASLKMMEGTELVALVPIQNAAASLVDEKNNMLGSESLDVKVANDFMPIFFGNEQQHSLTSDNNKIGSKIQGEGFEFGQQEEIELQTDWGNFGHDELEKPISKKNKKEDKKALKGQKIVSDKKEEIEFSQSLNEFEPLIKPSNKKDKFEKEVSPVVPKEFAFGEQEEPISLENWGEFKQEIPPKKEIKKELQPNKEIHSDDQEHNFVHDVKITLDEIETEFNFGQQEENNLEKNWGEFKNENNSLNKTKNFKEDNKGPQKPIDFKKAEEKTVIDQKVLIKEEKIITKDNPNFVENSGKNFSESKEPIEIGISHKPNKPQNNNQSSKKSKNKKKKKH